MTVTSKRSALLKALPMHLTGFQSHQSPHSEMQGNSARAPLTARQKEKSRAQDADGDLGAPSGQDDATANFDSLLDSGRVLTEQLRLGGSKRPADHALQSFCAAAQQELQNHGDKTRAMELLPLMAAAYEGLNQQNDALDAYVAAASLQKFSACSLRPIMPVLGRLLATHGMSVDTVASRLTGLLTPTAKGQPRMTLPRETQQDLVRQVVGAATDFRSPTTSCSINDYAQALSLLDRFGDVSGAAQELKSQGYTRAPQGWQRRLMSSDQQYFTRLFERVGGEAASKPVYDAFLRDAAKADRRSTAGNFAGIAMAAAWGVLAGLGPFFYLMATGVTAVSLGMGLVLCTGFIIFPAALIALRMAYHLHSPWGGSDL